MSACLLTCGATGAQQPRPPVKAARATVDLAVTYASEKAQIAPGSCCFWMQGGAMDAAMTFWKGFGVAASLEGDHASDVSSGVDVNKITYMAGPRYTHDIGGHQLGAMTIPHFQIFGQGLFGSVHGFNGLYPTLSSTTSSADAFAMQAGGGVNLPLSKRIGLRLFQVDYLRTTLPNNNSNTQNDLRLAIGVTYQIRKK